MTQPNSALFINPLTNLIDINQSNFNLKPVQITNNSGITEFPSVLCHLNNDIVITQSGFTDYNNRWQKITIDMMNNQYSDISGNGIPNHSTIVHHNGILSWSGIDNSIIINVDHSKIIGKLTLDQIIDQNNPSRHFFTSTNQINQYENLTHLNQFIDLGYQNNMILQSTTNNYRWTSGFFANTLINQLNQQNQININQIESNSTNINKYYQSQSGINKYDTIQNTDLNVYLQQISNLGFTTQQNQFIQVLQSGYQLTQINLSGFYQGPNFSTFQQNSYCVSQTSGISYLNVSGTFQLDGLVIFQSGIPQRLMVNNNPLLNSCYLLGTNQSKNLSFIGQAADQLLQDSLLYCKYIDSSNSQWNYLKSKNSIITYNNNNNLTTFALNPSGTTFYLTCANNIMSWSQNNGNIIRTPNTIPYVDQSGIVQAMYSSLSYIPYGTSSSTISQMIVQNNAGFIGQNSGSNPQWTNFQNQLSFDSFWYISKTNPSGFTWTQMQSNLNGLASIPYFNQNNTLGKIAGGSIYKTLGMQQTGDMIFEHWGRYSSMTWETTNDYVAGAAVMKTLPNSGNWVAMSNTASKTYSSAFCIHGSTSTFALIESNGAGTNDFFEFYKANQNNIIYQTPTVYTKLSYFNYLGNYTVISDKKKKIEICDDVNDINYIDSLSKKQIRKYYLKNDELKQEINGFYAQDLQNCKCFKNCIDRKIWKEGDAQCEEEDKDILFVDQTNLVQISKRLVQQEKINIQQQQQIDQQQQQIDQLMQLYKQIK